MQNAKPLSGKNRHPVRLHLTNGLIAQIGISQVRGQPVQSRLRKVVVSHISTGGMAVVTILDFPVTLQYVVQIQLEIGHTVHQLYGQIIWRKPLEYLTEYGIAFIVPPSSKRSLIYSLNHILLQQSPQQHKIHKMYQQMNAAYYSLDSRRIP
ncbi:PilZ domain-containing protein [Paenibacillus pinihumi]|uniref:PilZ domain-containing protein n=1 Tax=Paenibacillus pinihumi TaxID=669462 RepID=UPI0013774A11|nr:PilZ domain-containing protein [Paenibacillus pinihumi]